MQVLGDKDVKKKGLPPLKKAVGKMDPMLDMYSKEGIFGAKPGMVKDERGKEVPIEKVAVIEEKKKVDEKVVERYSEEREKKEEEEEKTKEKIKKAVKSIHRSKAEIDYYKKRFREDEFGLAMVGAPVSAALCAGAIGLATICDGKSGMFVGATGFSAVLVGAGFLIGAFGGIATGFVTIISTIMAVCTFPLFVKEYVKMRKEIWPFESSIADLKTELVRLEKEGYLEAVLALKEIAVKKKKDE